MINLYDIAWGLGVVIAAPYWLIKAAARNKVRAAFGQRMGRDIPPREGLGPCVFIHAVSLGEMNATRALVQKLREQRPGIHFAISATTETGYERGRELYGPAPDVTLLRYPLDFSPAIARALDATRPDVVVLMELEVWPNFVLRCRQRNIPVILGNARLTTSSFRNYKLGGPIVRTMFRRLTLVMAQDDPIGVRFLELGVPHHHIAIGGTMKFDNANINPPPRHQVENRAASLGLDPSIERVWVCGSTGPGEEEMVLRVYRKLLVRHTRLRLVIVPRHPQRFDEVADVIHDHRWDCVRLSRMDTLTLPPPGSPVPPVVLVDAMGVLREFYAMAEVVFVGRSLVDLGPRQHGSDMIEPAALAKPVIVGPYTGNFADAMSKFRAAHAIMEIGDEEQLERAVGVMLSTPKEAAAIAKRAADVVKREQGATLRHVRVILQILAAKRGEDLTNPNARDPFPTQDAPGGVTLPPGQPTTPTSGAPAIWMTIPPRK